MNKYILALTLMTSFISGPVNATLIDDFSDGSMHIVADTMNVYQASSSAFGSGRTVSIIKQGGGAKADVISYLGGLYAHNSDAQSSATSTISWSNSTGIDLIENVNNVFALDIYSNDLGNSDFVISVTDSTDHAAYSTLSGAGEGIYDIAFSDFSGINFNQITDIKLQIIGGLEADLALSSLSTTVGQVGSVPVPPALILFTSSLAIMVSLSRRRIK